MASGLGLGIRVHVVPFQRRIRVLPGPLLGRVMPTAQALLAEVAVTPERLAGPGLGLGTCVQVVPFHRSISVLVPVLEKPTAQALLADVAATPASTAPPAGLGLGTCFHAVPFHRTDQGLAPGSADRPGVAGGRGGHAGEGAAGSW